MTLHSRSHMQSVQLALSAIMTALSVVLMLLASLLSVFTYIAPIYCGLFLLPPLLAFGKKSAFITFLATAFLTLILGMDKELALFYLFFGGYPLIKPYMDRIEPRIIRLMAKAGLFIVLLALMYALLIFLLHIPVMDEFAEMGRIMTVFFFALMLICLFLYDYMIIPFILFYQKRYQKRLHRLLRIPYQMPPYLRTTSIHRKRP